MPYARQLSEWGPSDHTERPPDKALLTGFDQQIAAATVGVHNLKEYGASGSGPSGAAADHAAMQAAIAEANAAPYGGTVYIPSGDYYLAGGYVPDPDVRVAGAGYGQTTINHTGDNALFTCLTKRSNYRRSYSHFFVSGNSGASARAFDVGNAYGIRFEGVGATGYSGNQALRIQNTAAGDTFTEGLLMNHCKFYNNLVNIRCERNGGTDSLSDMRIVSCQLTADLVNSVNISLGDNLTWYAGSLAATKLHNNRSTAVCLDVGNGTQIVDTVFNCVDEGWTSQDATAGIGIRGTATSVIRAVGRFQLYSGANTLNHSVASGGVFRISGGGVGGVQTRGDGNFTVAPDVDASTQLVNTNQLAARTITLSGDKAWGGCEVEVVMDEPTPSAFTKTVVDGTNSATLHTFAASTRGRAKFVYGRASWFRAGASTF